MPGRSDRCPELTPSSISPREAVALGDLVVVAAALRGRAVPGRPLPLPRSPKTPAPCAVTQMGQLFSAPVAEGLVLALGDQLLQLVL